MTKKIEFYFDVGSPMAYLANGHLKKLAEKYDAELVYEPMLLGAVHKATNNLPPITVPAKGKYMFVHDIPRYVKRWGAEFVLNSHFPINTVQLMRGCLAAKELGCFENYIQVVFDGMWAKDMNLGDQAVLIELLNENGMDGERIVAMTGEQAIKDQLKDVTAKAIEREIFGAPTMFVGDNMYFGQDRLDFIEDELAGKA